MIRRSIQTTVLTTLLLGAASESQAQLKFNFDDGVLPPGTSLFGEASLRDEGGAEGTSVHLTELNFSSSGHFLVPNVGNGKPVRQISIQWRSLVGGGDGGGADGYSLNWATDLPETPDYFNPGEEGGGSGLTVTVDTFDNGGGEAPGIEIKWKSSVVAFASIPKDDTGSGTYLRRNQFVDAQVTVDAKGTAQFTYDGVTITAPLDGWKGISGGDILFGARTGGANDRHWIDDVQITTGLFTAGVFNGLFYESDEVRHERSGFFSLKLTPKGSFSGYLMLAGVRYPVKGAFDLETLTTRLEVPRVGTTTLTVDLALENTDLIRGTVTDGIWRAGLEADRQVFDKKLNQALAYAGQYTAVFDRGGDSQTPGGYGYGTLAVDAAGGVKFAGSLADGSKVTQKVAVSKRGVWPFYASLYGGQGSVLGWTPVDNSNDVSRRVTWTKRSGVPGPLYPSGFTFNPKMSVAPYTVPASGTKILELTSGSAEFVNGNLGSSFLSDFVLTPENKIIDLSSNHLNLKFVTKTGLFMGTVMVPGTGITLKFSGVAYKHSVAAGFFIGPTESGSVLLSNDR